MKICCFTGHSDIYEDMTNLKNRIRQTAEELILKQGVTEFWCGNYGAFDRLSASAVRSLKQRYGIKLCLVIPYITKEIEDHKEHYTDFDEIIIADIPENTPKRFFITKNNQYMVNCSDFLISYVRHDWGGAAQTLGYAGKKDIQIIKL